jgi:hypothetical protein
MQPTIVENGKNNSKMLETRIKIAVKLAGGAKKLSENGKFAASTIYNYMKVDPVPPIDFVWMLAEAAGVRAEWLFTGQTRAVTRTWKSAVLDLARLRFRLSMS